MKFPPMPVRRISKPSDRPSRTNSIASPSKPMRRSWNGSAPVRIEEEGGLVLVRGDGLALWALGRGAVVRRYGALGL